MPGPRSRPMLWLLGSLLVAGTAFGAYWQLRPAHPPTPAGPSDGETCPVDGPSCDSSDGLTLEESERDYLWQIEHGGNLLVKHGFGPFAAALRQADGPALLALCAADFHGGEPAQAAWSGDGLITVRRAEGGTTTRPLGRDQFVQSLLAFRREFHAEPKVKLSLMQLHPADRASPDGPWEGTCQLRVWGEKVPGQPAEVIAYLSYRVRKPTEEGMKTGGWLSACAIDQSQVGSAGHFLMREAAEARGLEVAALHDNWKAEKTIGATGGVYVCDFDRDGILDMLVVDVNGFWLYQGQKDGQFRDVTQQMGLPRWPPADGWAVPAAFVDLDGDGWDDLILGRSVYRNEGGQRFTNVTGRCNLRLPKQTIGFAVADYDRDGRLDLYAVQNGDPKADSWLDGKSGKDDGNHLFRNLGNWQFEDVTVAAGAGGGRRSSFTAVWLDANDDGWPDLFVPNEFGNGVLLVNQQNGTFKEKLLSPGPSDFGTMGVTAGDVDNDGHIDLYLANMYSKAGQRVIGNLKPGTYPDDVTARLKTFVSGSQLHRNRGGLEFEPKGKEWQIADCGWAYGPALADLDNDGWLDLYATAGYISRDRSKPDG
jgi:hypothetical protein